MQRRGAAAAGLSRRPKRSCAYRNSTNPVVSVIIPAMNERKTIAGVIRQSFKVHPLCEVIVVANGSTDGTARIARIMGARVIHYTEPLGHDVGRAIGAAAAKGRVLLFTDGDFIIPARQLQPLIRSVLRDGVDVALNQYNGPVRKLNVHSVVLAKHALNYSLSRQELKGASLTTIPHALSRRAVEEVGAENLAIPPKAQAMAILRGLKVLAVHHIDVGKKNRIRRRRDSYGEDPLTSLILGDHLEALHYMTSQTNQRGGKTDLHRIRELAR
jgi:glycosyltransferase involved in cell wall biosynthesis